MMQDDAVASVDVTLTSDDMAALTEPNTALRGLSTFGWTWVALRGTVALGLVVLAFAQPFAWLTQIRWSRFGNVVH